MKKNITYNICIIILFLFIGAGCMYLIIQHYPLAASNVGGTTNTIEKNITVNENNGISKGIENIYDAVVVVENYNNSKLSGIGSGFVYDKEGYIMTNHHVIENATEIKVTTMSGESLNATVIGSDEYADIAVIKIDKKYVTKVASIGNNETTKLGDTVFTIGSPMSSTYAGTVTRGILSGKNRMVEVSVSSSTNDWIMNVMQTDAAINPGNSGGPLCNINGDVIGINSMKVVQSEIEGIGFAIPIEDAMEYANKIVKGEEIKRAYLGISMAEISTSKYYLKRQGISIDDSITSGVIVVSVEDKGPSDKAGIEKGDVIVKIGKYNVKNVAELRYYLYKHEPNDKVDLEVIRGATKTTLKITLGAS